MFHDYRQQLTKLTHATWSDKRYIAPLIGISEQPRDSVAEDEPAWKTVLKTLLQKPKRTLWLIEGQSGLGKTALLEQWTVLALKLSQTPLLIRLGSDLKATKEAAALMGLGDINVNQEVAMDLLTGGGFLIFLDAFNEDTTPDATREFVRRVIKRNLVVMTSQVDPRWDQWMNVQRIRLEPFGREQLAELMNAERLDLNWIDAILESAHLKEVVRLPETAKLLTRFIVQNKRLPDYSLAIYDDLRNLLTERPEMLNLEKIAWDLFKANDFNFTSSNRLPSDFCEEAIDVGVLTRRTGDTVIEVGNAPNFHSVEFRFAHERIHRFLVAYYLDRQDPKPLEDWHADIRADLGREYWADALEFWGEIQGHRSSKQADSLNAYKEWLKEAAKFQRSIFASRLWPQYSRLYDSCEISGDGEFEKWAADFLAKE